MKNLFFVMVAVLLSCTQSPEKFSNAAENNKDTSKTDLDYPMTGNDGFLLDYADGLGHDTIIDLQVGRIKISNNIDTGITIEVPERYLYDGIKRNAYENIITLGYASNSGKKLIINRSLWAGYIDDQNAELRKYAVPLYWHVSKVDSTGNIVSIKFSASIPYTDLGEDIEICCDLSAFQVCR